MGIQESKKPLFIMCLGAQKAGTSWLFSQIRKHPESAFEHLQLKEAHFFDRPELSGFRKPHKKIRLFLKSLWLVPPLARARKRNNWSAYIETYRTAAVHGAVGDFTPEYSLLTARQWKIVVAALEPHFDLRFVFLVRDPLERMESAIRHGLRSPETGILGRHFREPATAFEWVSRGDLDLAHLAKSNYPKILHTIAQVIPPQAILLQHYEALFSLNSYNCILEHCGLSPVREVSSQQRINSSPKTEYDEFNEAQKERLKEKLAHVYRWADERWGQEHMRRIWPNHP